MTPVGEQTAAHDDPRVVQALEAYLADLEAGRAPDRAAVLREHPDVAAALAECLDGLDLLHRAHSARAVGPGDRLGDFRLVREVGRGGMGVVYEAVQESLGRRVAVKVLPLAGGPNGTELERFRNEARAAAALTHPHIVPVYAVGCDRGAHFFAMHFVPGRSLARVIEGRERAGPDLPRFAAGVLRQAAEALAHAHARGIVHRDVTPGNLLLDDRGHLWVADFGLARVPGADRLTRSGGMVGTLRYMSPEQVDARLGMVDQRTDLYGLGAVVYELLTGRPPFPADDRKELLARILTASPTPPRRLNPAVPVDLETVVLKLLAKEPADRYRSAADLADDARRFLAGEPVRARRPSAAERAARWAGRHRKLTAAAVAGVAVLVAVLGTAQYRLAAERERTRAVVDDFFTRFAELDLAHRPGADADRRDLLLKARDHYERLAGGWTWSREGRLAAARAWRRVADIDARLGRAADAERAYGEGLARLEQLAAADPGAAEPRRELAAAANNRGNLYRLTGRLDAAERDYRAAADAYRAAGDMPDDRAGLAGVENNLGLVWQLRDRPTEAEACFREARDWFARLAADAPDRADYPAEAAGCCHNLGNLAAEAGRDADARAEYERAVAFGRRAAVLAPGHPALRRGLARYQVALAAVLVRLGGPAEAEPLAREAVADLRRLADDFPHAPAYRYDLAVGHRAWGDALAALGRPADARSQYEVAGELFRRLVEEGQPMAAAELARIRLATARAATAAGDRLAAEWLVRDAARVADGLGGTRFERQTQDLCRAEFARLRP